MVPNGSFVQIFEDNQLQKRYHIFTIVNTIKDYEIQNFHLMNGFICPNPDGTRIISSVLLYKLVISATTFLMNLLEFNAI